jgi:hypothetical protein
MTSVVGVTLVRKQRNYSLTKLCVIGCKMSNDALCKNCLHWSSRDGQWGWCALAQSTAGYPMTETLAYARDLDMYDANLITNENFGCVQYETGDLDA